MIDSDTCPVISVVVPVYNGEKYLQECINSITNQTIVSFEAIFVDDGSTDKSFRILHANSLLDNRIKIIRQPNLGATSARKNGVKIAKGEWICFVDCDDRLLPETLQLLLNEAIKNRVDIVCGNSNYAYRINTNHFLNSMEYVAALLRREIDIVLWAKLYRREILVEDVFDISPDMKFAEDYIMNIKIGFKVEKVSCIQDLVYQYEECRENSITSTFRLSTSYVQEICSYILREIDMHNAKCVLYKSRLLFLKYMIWMMIHHNVIDMNNDWVNKTIEEIAPVLSYREKMYLKVKKNSVIFKVLKIIKQW